MDRLRWGLWIAYDGFSEVHGFGVYTFDFGVGTHHKGVTPEENREHSIRFQFEVLNVWGMDRLLYSSL